VIIKHSEKSKRSTATVIRLSVAHKRALPESAVSYICASNPWANKFSRLIRPRVDFHICSSSILCLSHDLGERESY